MLDSRKVTFYLITICFFCTGCVKQINEDDPEIIDALQFIKRFEIKDKEDIYVNPAYSPSKQ